MTKLTEPSLLSAECVLLKTKGSVRYQTLAVVDDGFPETSSECFSFQASALRQSFTTRTPFEAASSPDGLSCGLFQHNFRQGDAEVRYTHP